MGHSVPPLDENEKALGSLAVFRPQKLFRFNLITPHTRERIARDYCE